LVSGAPGAAPHVQVQAVFAARRFTWHRRCRRCGTRRRAATAWCPTAPRCSTAAGRRRSRRAWRAEGVRLAHAVPLRRWLRRPPPVLAERRRREREPLIGADVGLDRAGSARDEAGFGL